MCEYHDRKYQSLKAPGASLGKTMPPGPSTCSPRGNPTQVIEEIQPAPEDIVMPSDEINEPNLSREITSQFTSMTDTSVTAYVRFRQRIFKIRVKPVITFQDFKSYFSEFYRKTFGEELRIQKSHSRR
jgi:hypothetical protein